MIDLEGERGGRGVPGDCEGETETREERKRERVRERDRPKAM